MIAEAGDMFFIPQGKVSLNIIQVFSSPELLAQVSFPDVSIYPLSVNFSHFDFFSRTSWSISAKFGTDYYLVKFLQMRRMAFSKGR
jgi:hypothetical protein